MPRKISYLITEEENNIKIGIVLKYKKGFSERLIRSLKTTEEGITLNGVHARTIDLVHTGDTLAVSIPEGDSEIEPVKTELDVIYEDDDIIVINKNPFMAMHPSHNHQGDTLANSVAAHLAEKGKTSVFRAVGRLDKGTSGLVVCAINPLAAGKLSGKVKKEYIAVVKGHPDNEGTVNVPIYRPDPMKTLRACSYELGEEEAITHWQVIERRKESSVIKLNLETGRTHQIRVHMSYIGHPLAGDKYYGDFMPEFGHQLLHCHKIWLTHPVTGEEMTFDAPMPQEFIFD